MDPSADTLNGTNWDVVIVGTDVAQALLALALSRSGKKILHIDENDYYGGSHAAFTLQEASEWVEKVKGRKKKKNNSAVLSQLEASISVKENDSSAPTAPASASASELSYSRAYSLSLLPQIIYARSQLLQALVSSKAFKQLEFLTVGSFWTYSPDRSHSDIANVASSNQLETSKPKRLRRVPNGREDIFADRSFTPQEKRNMMKFLRFISQSEQLDSTCQPWASRPLATFLTEFFEIPASLHDSLYALTMLLDCPENITTDTAMDCFRRHVTSMGIFGPGFPAVVPRWGGMSEVAQVACRACAVGGGVYVLGKGIEWEGSEETDHKASASHKEGSIKAGRRLILSSGESVTTNWLIGSEDTLPRIIDNSGSLSTTNQKIQDKGYDENENAHARQVLSRSVSIVSSSLPTYFAHRVEGAPAPAVAVVYFPAGAFISDQSAESGSLQHPPIQVLVHSSDTGECPAGQCVLYASVMMPLKEASAFLEKAVNEVLAFADTEEAGESPESPETTTEDSSTSKDQPGVSEDSPAAATSTISSTSPTTQVLWRMQYEQQISRPHEKATAESIDSEAKDRKSEKEGQLTSQSTTIRTSSSSPSPSSSNPGKVSRPKVALLPTPLQARPIPSDSSECTNLSLSDFLVFDDQVLESVRKVWKEIMESSDGGDYGSAACEQEGHQAEGKGEGKDEGETMDIEFMRFGDREVDADADVDDGNDDEDNDNETEGGDGHEDDDGGDAGKDS